MLHGPNGFRQVSGGRAATMVPPRCGVAAAPAATARMAATPPPLPREPPVLRVLEKAEEVPARHESPELVSERDVEDLLEQW